MRQTGGTMKLGLLSAILGEMPFEKMVDFAGELKLECVEVACWPVGRAERRYAGVSHIDVEHLTKDRARYLLEYCEKRGVAISALAYYPNILEPELEKRNRYIRHLLKVIDAAAMLNVNTVTSFIGRIPDKTVDENLSEMEKVWKPILEYAADKKVRIAIENCPMLFTEDEWPGGQNLMTSPSNWRKIFQILDYDNLGLNYDPSHFVWQQIDYIRPLYEFKDKIFHVHFKDIKLYPDKLRDVGIMSLPLEYMAPKIPGLGDVDWSRYVSALTDIGYNGYACIEIEDKAFEDSLENAQNAVRLSTRYLRNFIA